MRARINGFTRATASIMLAITLACSAVSSPAAAQGKDDIIVFAAASLKNALDNIAAQWHIDTGNTAKTSYAASSALAKQIEQDAPADVMISADLDWMDYLAARSLIKPNSRINLLGNQLVLIAPKDSAVTVDLKEGVDVAKVLGDGRLATGQVNSVPAGKYAKAALVKLGAWSGVQNQLAEAESVRAALVLVSRGEAPLGIVYRSDAVSDPKVKIIATFPEDSHPPIIYPAALTLKAKDSAAAFLAYLKSDKAKALFEAQGFAVLQ